MNLQAEIDAGQQAQRIIENPLWAQAHEQWRSDILSQLKRLAHDPAACQQCANLLIAGDKFRAFIEQAAQTGQLAMAQLDANQQDN